MKSCNVFGCTLPGPCSASQRSDGLHGYHAPIEWCVLWSGSQKGEEIMQTCWVPTGVEMPERLLVGVIEHEEPVDVRVGVLEGVPALLGTLGRRMICLCRMFPCWGCRGGCSRNETR